MYVSLLVYNTLYMDGVIYGMFCEIEETRDEVWTAFNSTLEPVFAAGSLGVILFQVICLLALYLCSFSSY